MCRTDRGIPGQGCGCTQADTSTSACPETPHRTVVIAPSQTALLARTIADLNVGLAVALTYSLTEHTTRDTTDPIKVWDTLVATVTGAPQDELDTLTFPSLDTEPEARVETAVILELACAATRIAGRYITRSQGGAEATPARVIEYIHAGPGDPLRTQLRPTAEDVDAAAVIREWVRSSMVATNDYLRSLAQLTRQTLIGFGDIGTVASAVGVYLQAVEEDRLATRPARRADRPEKARSRWLNQPGDRIRAEVTVARVRKLGPTAWLYLLRTEHGDLLKVITERVDGVREGDLALLRGQVKSHITYQGTKQTELFYALLDPVDTAAARMTR